MTTKDKWLLLKDVGLSWILVLSLIAAFMVIMAAGSFLGYLLFRLIGTGR